VGRISAPEVRKSGPPSTDAAIAAVAARQHGVVTLAQLRAAGLGDRAVHKRAARGRLHRVHRGVYAVGHPALSADGRRLAAVLACGPGAVLSHRSAAAAWGLRPSSGARLDVSTARRGRGGPSGVALHRVRRLDAADVTRLGPLAITTIARTLVDLAGVLRADALERAVHEAEVARLLDVVAVDAALARAPGRGGAAALRRLLATPSPGPTRSVLEERFLALCRRAEIPLPRLNAHVPTAALGLLEVDALWRPEAVVVELDGAAAHRTRRAFEADRRRDAALAAEGHVVVRLTWQRVTREGDAMASELRRTLAARGRAGGPNACR
jgi:hypothetical protein